MVGKVAFTYQFWRRPVRSPQFLLAKLFRTAPLSQLKEDAEASPLKPVLEPFDVIALGIGGIIGASIFSQVGSLIAGQPEHAGAGPSVILALFFTAVACLFCALCYAEFASLVPLAGSAYTYAYATLGELVAWIIGWDLLLEYAISNSVVAMSWSSYMYDLCRYFEVHIPAWLAVNYRTAVEGATDVARVAWEHHPSILGIPVIFDLLAVIVVMGITWLLLAGVKDSAATTKWIVSLKLLTLLLFITVGLGFVKIQNWSEFMPNGLQATWHAASTLFFAYIGFDAVSTAAEDCKNPGRDLWIGILGSLGICMGLYICVAAVLTGIVYWGNVRLDRPLVEALRQIGFPTIANLVSTGAVLATTTTLLVFQYGQVRILFRMSRDGLLPACFGKVHPLRGVPHIATLVTGLAVIIVSSVCTKEEIVDLTVIGTLFAFILVCAGIIALRLKFPSASGGFRTPWVPLVPIIGIASCLALMGGLEYKAWKRFGIWLVAGQIIYFAYGFRKSRLNRFF